MKRLVTFFAVMLVMLSALAKSSDNSKDYTESELVYHTAAPGIMAMPRSDVSQMVMAYDVTLTPREGKAYFRWIHLDDNGVGQGFWSRWRDYDEPVSFSTAGTYVLQTYAQAIGKEESPILNVTFRVNFLGMTMAPGITLTPFGQRGYYVSLSSFYDAEIYYRWRHYDSNTWYQQRLYTEPIPFTEAGKYVLEVHCEDDALGAYIEVPSVDYFKTGDVDHNGVVDINDLTTLINMLMDIEVMIGTGDVNKDGTINVSDITALIDILLKLD